MTRPRSATPRRLAPPSTVRGAPSTARSGPWTAKRARANRVRAAHERSDAHAERRLAERALAAQRATTGVLTRAGDAGEAMSGLLAGLGQAMDWRLGAWWSPDQDERALRCRAVWCRDGASAPEFELTSLELTLARGIGLPGRAWDTGQPHGRPISPLTRAFRDRLRPRGPACTPRCACRSSAGSTSTARSSSSARRPEAPIARRSRSSPRQPRRSVRSPACSTSAQRSSHNSTARDETRHDPRRLPMEVRRRARCARHWEPSGASQASRPTGATC